MVSLNDTFRLAGLYFRIEKSIFHLQATLNSVSLSALYYKNELEEKKVKKEFYQSIKKDVIHLNLVITDFNLKLKKDFSHLKCKPLSKVDPRKFKKIIDEFKGKGELAMNTPEKKQFDLKTRLELQTVIFEFRNFPENFKNLFSPFYLRRGEPKANKLDKETVISAFDLFSIGYPQYSLLVICKSLEDRIKKYLFQLKKKGKIKIKLSELKEFDYDTMVNFLNKQKFITPSQHSKLLSIKWARNRIVHPSIRNHWSESKYDSEALIKLAINLLVDFHYKLKK